MKKRFVSVEEFDRLLNVLTDKIILHPVKYKRIVGIANGGLPVSHALAVRLSLPHSVIRISHYDGCKLRQTPIVEGELVNPTGNLFVDDLIDDGWTMRTLAKDFGLVGNATAVLFWKRGSFIPSFYAAEKPKEWIIFPWEIKTCELMKA